MTSKNVGWNVVVSFSRIDSVTGLAAVLMLELLCLWADDEISEAVVLLWFRVANRSKKEAMKELCSGLFSNQRLLFI